MRNITKRRRALMFTLKKQSIIPDDYQEVVWLMGTGTQYCETSYAPVINPNGYTEIKGDFTIVNSNYSLFIGSNFYATPAYSYGVETSSLGVFLFNGSENSEFGYSINSYPTDVHYEIDKNKYIINNSTRYDSVVSTVPSPQKILIGAIRRMSGLEYRNRNVKIGTFAISTNGEIISYFIPCYRKADYKPGFYETGTGRFLTNLNSGSDWLVGNDV